MNRYLTIFLYDVKKVLMSAKINIILVMSLISSIFAGKMLLKSADIAFVLLMPKIFAVFIVIASVLLLANEFMSSRYMVLFTNNMSRIGIMLVKGGSNVVICLVWGIYFNIARVVINKIFALHIDIAQYFISILVFALFGGLVSAVANFFVVLTQNFVVPYLACFFLFLDAVSGMVAELGNHVNITWIGDLLRNNVFVQAVHSFSAQSISSKSAIQILIAIVVINGVSSLFFRYKDIL